MTFTIPGAAVPQGRPRFFRRGSFTGAYDPAKSKAWKEYVRLTAIAAGCKPLQGALSMEVVFFLPCPKNLAKRLERGENIAHIKKPDCSNLVKAVEDALNGICYDDDSQITDSRVVKQYATVPSVFVRIRKIRISFREVTHDG